LSQDSTHPAHGGTASAAAGSSLRVDYGCGCGIDGNLGLWLGLRLGLNSHLGSNHRHRTQLGPLLLHHTVAHVRGTLALAFGLITVDRLQGMPVDQPVVAAKAEELVLVQGL